MALFTFYQIFNVLDDDTLEFIYRTKIGDITFEPNSKLRRGTIVGGIDFFDFLGHNMEIQEEGDTKIIERVYV